MRWFCTVDLGTLRGGRWWWVVLRISATQRAPRAGALPALLRVHDDHRARCRSARGRGSRDQLGALLGAHQPIQPTVDIAVDVSNDTASEVSAWIKSTPRMAWDSSRRSRKARVSHAPFHSLRAAAQVRIGYRVVRAFGEPQLTRIAATAAETAAGDERRRSSPCDAPGSAMRAPGRTSVRLQPRPWQRVMPRVVSAR